MDNTDNSNWLKPYNQGYTNTEISRMCGVHFSTIAYRLNVLGLKPNYKSRKGIKLKTSIVPDITINRPERYMVKISHMKLEEVERELSKYNLPQPICALAERNKFRKFVPNLGGRVI